MTSTPILPNLVRIAYNVQLSEREVISFETTVEQSADIQTFNGVLKKLVTVAERQKYVAQLDKLRADYKSNELMLRVTEESVPQIIENDRARWDEGKRTGLYRQSRDATLELQNAQVTASRHRNMLHTIESQIVEYEGRLKKLEG
jgi:hypothetical protein